MRKIPRLVLGGVTLLLAACATTPLTPFPSSHPASPEAAEATIVPFQDRLAPDEATKRSNALLEAAEKGTPASPSNQTNDMQGMNMGPQNENH